MARGSRNDAERKGIRFEMTETSPASNPTAITPDQPALWQIAASMCARLHRHQQRKDGTTPYDSHPFRVALTVRHVFGVDDDAAIAAALLHDVIEDTAADYDDVAEACGTEVADIVGALTKDMRLPEDEREKAYDEQLARASWKARLVKLADVYDNVCDSTAGGMRRRALKKGSRAIACAGTDHPGLIEAARALESLIASATDAS